MAETPADVRRDIELTRERMSTTIDQLEQKLNLKQLVADHPWPAIAIAVGAGLALAGSKSDVKVAAAAAEATKGAGSRLGGALDEIVAGLMATATTTLHRQIDQFVDELKTSLTTNSSRSNGGGYGVGPVDMDQQRVPSASHNRDILRAD
jgi:hypothetical protein